MEKDDVHAKHNSPMPIQEITNKYRSIALSKPNDNHSVKRYKPDLFKEIILNEKTL